MSFGFGFNKPTTMGTNTVAKVELTEEQKNKTIEIIVQDIYNDLQIQVSQFSEIAEKFNLVDQQNYEFYYQVKSLYGKIVQINDKQHSNLNQMNSISQEQLEIYNQLISQNHQQNTDNQSLYNILIQSNDILTKIDNQVQNDQNLYEQVSDMSAVLNKISKYLNICQ